MRFNIPTRFDAGLTFYASAPACDGFSYQLLLRGPQSIDIAGSVLNGVASFAVPAAETAAWAAGQYRYSLRATAADGSVSEVVGGWVEVAANFATLPAGTDLRSHAQITLDAISAVIEKRASRDQERYTINNRELWRTPLSDLLKLRAVYIAKVRRERGGGIIREIPVVF